MINRIIQPPFGEIADFNFSVPNIFVLSNGIKVYPINGNYNEALKLEICFEAGSKFSLNPILAIAVNSLLTEGTKTKNSIQISNELDFLGSFIEKECSLDQAKLTIYSQEKNLKKILNVVNEILDQAIYPKSEIEIFKNIKLQKLQINKEKNAWIANQEFKKKLYKNDHPYGKSINEDAINSFSSSDLIDFYNSFYNPENCYLIVSGKVNEQTLNVINESLGQKNWNKNSSPIKNTIAKNIPIVSEKGSFKFDNSNKAQASIKYGRVLFNRTHPDFFGMQVLSTLLGGYFGSRLMKNIREEKGYTYGIGSSVVSNKDSGYFVISTEVKNEVKELTIQEIEKEIVTLQNVLVNTEELDLVKNYMLGSFLRMFDGVFSKSERLNTLIINDIDESHYLKYIEKIKNISAIELQNLANKYLNKHDITEIIVC